MGYDVPLDGFLADLSSQYGNEAGINAIYTRLAILISVGPADDRLKAPELPKQEPSTRRRRRY